VLQVKKGDEKVVKEKEKRAEETKNINTDN
jgi:hypothetical protein